MFSTADGSNPIFGNNAQMLLWEKVLINLNNEVFHVFSQKEWVRSTSQSQAQYWKIMKHVRDNEGVNQPLEMRIPGQNVPNQDQIIAKL